MRKLLWLFNGVVLGFIAAHFVNQTPEGRRFFDRVGRGVEEFGRAFSNGYHDAEQEDAEFEATLRDLGSKN